MGKAGRWLRSIFLAPGKKQDSGGIKGRERKKALPLPLPQPQGDATPVTTTPTPREKKRWSFRRPSSAAAQGKPKPASAPSPLSQEPSHSVSGREITDEKQAAEVAVVAADAAVMEAVARFTEEEDLESEVLLARWLVVEEAAAARIQATFRGYLARKALCALRGLVKLQALVRGQLVRRQATATLRRMQALLSAQSRLRAQRTRMLGVDSDAAQRRSPQHPRRRSSYEMDRSGDEHVKIVEMDPGEPEPAPARRGRSSCSAAAGESRERRLAEYYYHYGPPHFSPAPSSFADFSPRTHSGHLDDLLAPFDPTAAATTTPYDATGFVPSYMANTQSSRAKARSQSAPRQRTDGAALERQPSRRRAGGAPRKSMQRSVSHLAVPAACGYQQYQYPYPCPPWAAGVRLDRSSASLVGSECGSTTSSVLTAATVGGCGYGRALVGFEVHRAHY